VHCGRGGLPRGVEGFGEETAACWHRADDASLRGGTGEPLELLSPILCGANGLRPLRAACRALTAVGAVGAETHEHVGLPVHHEARDLDVAALRALLASYDDCLPAIERVLRPHRHHADPRACSRRGDAAQERAWADAADVRALARCSGRHVVSLAGLDWRGTVEFRQHHATIDATATADGIACGQRLIAAARHGHAPVLRVA